MSDRRDGNRMCPMNSENMPGNNAQLIRGPSASHRSQKSRLWKYGSRFRVLFAAFAILPTEHVTSISLLENSIPTRLICRSFRDERQVMKSRWKFLSLSSRDVVTIAARLEQRDIDKNNLFRQRSYTAASNNSLEQYGSVQVFETRERYTVRSTLSLSLSLSVFPFAPYAFTSGKSCRWSCVLLTLSWP